MRQTKIAQDESLSHSLMNSASNTRLLELNDRLLERIITAETDEARAAEVERVLVRVAVPVARNVIERFSLEEWRIASDARDDILSNISIRLLQKLRVVPHFEEEAIERFEDYVEVLAQHSIYDYLRKRFPGRSRLRNRLRYLFARDPKFAIWATPAGVAIGLRAWGGSHDVAAAIDPLDKNSVRFADAKRPAAAVEAVLRRTGRPVRLEALVAGLCELWNVDDEPRSANATTDDAPVVAQFETRQSLEILWEEILDLPPLQRAALLLNLRDPGGLNAIPHLVSIGVATIDAVASSVGMTAKALAAIWNELPLDDLTIAERLAVTRQQVINLRKSARERLARRLARRDSGNRKR